ncbi:MAG: T9SS type A sorting domain-containing protein [Candidatus Eiseniibacteriota bacterium]
MTSPWTMLHSLRRTIAFLAVALGLSADAHAQWMQNGLPVAPAGGRHQDSPHIASDGQGGVYVLWRDYRDDATNDADIYLQRLTGEGVIAPGWSSSGFPVVSRPGFQQGVPIAPDGLGGALIVSYDLVPTGYNLYAHRVLPGGAIAPGWSGPGVPVTLDPGYQHARDVLSDGAGGAFVAWDDEPSVTVRILHLTATGEIADGWPAKGRPIFDSASAQGGVELISDGHGGIIAVCADTRPYTELGASVWAIRVNADGSVAKGWAPEGIPVLPMGSSVERRRIVSDGEGGAFVAWNDNRVGIPTGNPFYFDIYAQHVLADGTMDPRWPVEGLPVCTAPSGQYVFDMTTDGQGGIFLVWEDYRNGYWQPFAQRILPDGSVAPGWSPNGVLISTQFATQINPIIATDGAGGFYAFWEEFPLGDYEIHGQHMTADARIAPGWTPEGLAVAVAGDEPGEFTSPQVCPDGRGGTIVAYDYGTPTGSLVYAQRISGDGPVPIQLSLIEASSEPGLVRLRWFAVDASQLRTTVYRRSATSDWQAIGSPGSQGPDHLLYEDRTAPPGRVAYRLAYFDGSEERFTEETWLDVQGQAELALAGFRPNPSIDGATIAFSLPDGEPATLEVHDVRGRAVFRRDVGSLGPGTHLVRMEESDRLSPGVYWIRLIHEHRALTVKGLVTR